ncbi:hypothetical protein E1292_02900 [Nonomuraea deserti]|uniref:Uncharacterized protein n=1 Tax=Nonomuraea deserti TaxID=1848322 RepID=A0A4R4W8J8_9ACTN|nr:hypothetical protein [Nonomuraea deserti]TDD12084.1 hypothetical protein E1292_02900 [Nonomuraea deserti]
MSAMFLHRLRRLARDRASGACCSTPGCGSVESVALDLAGVPLSTGKGKVLVRNGKGETSREVLLLDVTVREAVKDWRAGRGRSGAVPQPLPRRPAVGPRGRPVSGLGLDVSGLGAALAATMAITGMTSVAGLAQYLIMFLPLRGVARAARCGAAGQLRAAARGRPRAVGRTFSGHFAARF